jgi:hypothetical protein
VHASSLALLAVAFLVYFHLFMMRKLDKALSMSCIKVLIY